MEAPTIKKRIIKKKGEGIRANLKKKKKTTTTTENKKRREKEKRTWMFEIQNPIIRGIPMKKK